jgi:hypothetical protein
VAAAAVAVVVAAATVVVAAAAATGATRFLPAEPIRQPAPPRSSGAGRAVVLYSPPRNRRFE